MLAYLDPSRRMGAVMMFARPGCPFCARAEKLLEERGIPFERVDLGHGVTMNSVRAATGAAKVPQVFIAGRLIGGSDALQAFLDDHAPGTRRG
jgi:glutaredoxin-like protein